MRKSCVIYNAWADQLINLPQDKAGEYIQNIMKYAFYGEKIDSDDPMLNVMLIPVKKKLDEDLGKYQAKVERAKTISKRNQNDIETISELNRNDVEGVTDTVTDTVTVIKKKNKKKKAGFGNFPERTYDYAALMEETGNV